MLENKNNNQEESIYVPLTLETTSCHVFTDGTGNGSNRRKDDRTFMYYSLLTANILLFDCGCNFTWTSPAMTTLRSSDVNINPLGNPLTTVQESWIASSIHIGAVFGPLLFGKFPDIFGRRKTLMAIAVFKIASYFLLAFSLNIYCFCIARVFIGMGMGMTFAVLPMYIGEVVDDHHRGKMVTIMVIYANLGMLYTLTVGPLLQLKIFTLTLTIFLIICLTGFVLFIPESPVYLVSVGDKEAAKNTIMKLRRTDSVTAENYLTQIFKIAEKRESNESLILEIFQTAVLRKALLIGICLYSLQQLSGMFPITAFIAPIFEIAGSKVSPYLSSILVTLVQVTSITLSSPLIDKVGRRPLLLFSTTGITLSLISVGIYFFLKENESQYTDMLFWLPVTSLMIYMTSFSTGVGFVPLAIVSEIFPPNFRATASSFICFLAASLDFVVTFSFPVLMENLGSAKCFWIYSVFTALGTIFIYFFIPETKGKSILEIQNILGNKR